MKRGLLWFPVCALWMSCGLKEMKPIEMAQVTQIEDSIPHIVPGIISIHTYQDEDFSKVMLIVGTPSFYNAADNQKQQLAVRAGVMLLHILGPDNNIATAKLVFTKKDNNEKKVPADGLPFDMKIDSLKKEMFPKK